MNISCLFIVSWYPGSSKLETVNVGGLAGQTAWKGSALHLAEAYRGLYRKYI